jgi:hypothetical protein
MTKDEQRIAIVEACGNIYVLPIEGINPTAHRIVWENSLPDYPNDLNAIAVAESTLTHDQWRIYLGFLMGERTIPKLASMEEFHKAWNSTSAQRAEAFLRTIGKWKDV